MTADGAGERLSLSRAAIYRLIRRGTIPSVKIGRARRIRVADLQAFTDRLSNTEEPAV